MLRMLFDNGIKLNMYINTGVPKFEPRLDGVNKN